MKYPVNTRVKVKSVTDDTSNPQFIGATGRVTGHIERDTGATPEDPLHRVSFNQPVTIEGEEPWTGFSFWYEELEEIK